MTLPFAVRKLGHVVVNVADLEKSKRFYTEVLGFQPTDIYGDDKMPGGMVFLRCNGDHHCLALIGGAPPAGEARRTLHHLAFELATLDEVFRARDHLRRHGATIVYEGRRRAGCQVSVEFLDPDGHHLELFWGLDQIGTDGRVRPADEWRQTATLEDAVRFAPPGQDTTLHDASLKRADAAE
jgi:catechol 2,3-dioxygenase-like lactoylglutathione lyase family enzyme